MATETLRTTSFSAPAPGVSGTAGGGTATTGTADPVALCRETAQKTESVQWSAVAAAAHYVDWTAVSLKVPWTIAALIAVGQTPAVCCASNSVRLEYSTNAGSSWTAFSGFPKSATSSPQSGTATAALSTSVTVANVRVRLVVETNSDQSCLGDPISEAPCGCKPSASVTDVYLEATYSIATGACCSGTSCSVTTEGACSGTYKGDGTSCSPSPCQSGACCSGSSCSVTSPALCGGTYKGNGTTCSPNPCTTTGGCCVGTSCSTMTSAACTTAGGSYYGDGTSCTTGQSGAACASACGAGVCCGAGGYSVRSNSCLCADLGVTPAARWRAGVTVTGAGACGKFKLPASGFGV